MTRLIHLRNGLQLPFTGEYTKWAQLTQSIANILSICFCDWSALSLRGKDEKKTKEKKKQEEDEEEKNMKEKTKKRSNDNRVWRTRHDEQTEVKWKLSE